MISIITVAKSVGWYHREAKTPHFLTRHAPSLVKEFSIFNFCRLRPNGLWRSSEIFVFWPKLKFFYIFSWVRPKGFALKTLTGFSCELVYTFQYGVNFSSVFQIKKWHLYMFGPFPIFPIVRARGTRTKKSLYVYRCMCTDTQSININV